MVIDMSEIYTSTIQDDYTDDPKVLYEDEMEYINKRRIANGLDNVFEKRQLWGICFSGGGIRSATLCLGIMQKFMRENIFRFFDYLSTVSGGGYIGSCLTSLLSDMPMKEKCSDENRERINKFNEIKRGVQTDDSPFVGLNEFDDKGKRLEYELEDDTRIGVRHQMHHLRTHGEYLVTNRDILSRDLQRAVGAIFTGIIHHLALFTLILVTLTCLLHFFLFSITGYPDKDREKEPFEDKMPLLYELNYSSRDYYKINDGVLRTLIIEGVRNNTIDRLKLLEGKVFYHGKNDFLSTLKQIGCTDKETDLILEKASDPGDSQAEYLKNILKTWAYCRLGAPLKALFKGDAKTNILFYHTFFFLLGIYWGILAFRRIKAMNEKIRCTDVDTDDIKSGFNIEDHCETRFILRYDLIPVFLVTLLTVVFGYFYSSLNDQHVHCLWVLLLPLSFAIGAAFLSIARNNQKRFRDGEDRVLRSLCNGVLGASFYGILLSLLVPVSIIFLFSLDFFELKFWWTLISLAITYLIFKESGQAGKKIAFLSKLKKPLLMIFIFLFIALAYNLISGLLIKYFYPGINLAWPKLNFAINWSPLIPFGVSSILVVFMGFFVNSNKLSPHYFYRDRLTEAYLQTDARIKRKNGKKPMQGKPLINVRDHEELRLSDMGDMERIEKGKGPYHIIVTALNLQGSDELNRKKMLSEHFIFSKFYIGSSVTGFVKTGKYCDGTIKLARAMTISAAAAGSAMGQYTFGALSFAATLFNVRLGYWMANPWFYKNKKVNPEPQKPFWPKWLLMEMIGKCNARDRMVNLSDGGHTGDNLGLMPLLERRCKVIVVCDGEADNEYVFESFNNAVRMAYIERKIKIAIDLSPIIPEKNEDGSYKLSKKSVAIGDITYPGNNKDDKDSTGKLIYIKASLSEPERDKEIMHLPVHVNNYHAGHKYFPHQNTTDQFFDDAQFEAYRDLGEHICRQAVDEMKAAHIVKKVCDKWEICI